MRVWHARALALRWQGNFGMARDRPSPYGARRGLDNSKHIKVLQTLVIFASRRAIDIKVLQT